MDSLASERHSATNLNLIDLTDFYNAALDQTWHGSETNNDLSALPRGVQTFAGVQFDVRGLIQLACRKPASTNFPAAVRGIRLGMKCRRLHFLHAATMSWGATNGEPIARFTIHYANTGSSERTICFGADVRDWWVHPKQQPAGVDQAVVAWRGTNVNGQALQLFRTTWEHPHPDLLVERLDYRSALNTAAPFLIAVTVEP